MRPQATGAVCLFVAMFLAPAVRAERWLVRNPDAQARPMSARLQERGIRVLQEYRIIPWAAVEGPETALRKLEREGLIAGFEPDLPRYLSGTPSARPAAFPWLVALSMLALWGCGEDEEDAGLPGPEQKPSWGWLKIRADQAQARSTGKGVRVVVIDSGIDAEHPDLEVAGGKNFVLGSPSAGAREWDDCFGHGTHVAGIIAARQNEIGVSGVAPDVELYAARVFNCEGDGASISNILSALDWAVEQRAQVVNMSFGSGFDSEAERAGMEAAEAAGVVLVAASGNGSADGSPAPLDYPAAYPWVLGVGATDETDELASFSNQGPELGLTAPGVGILSSVVVGSAVVASVKQSTQGYESLGLTYSGTGQVEAKLYSCGLAASAADCPAAVRGNIALIQRGENFFSEKVTNAMAAGASAAIIYNHREADGGLFSGTLLEPGAWIPAVSLSNADGLSLRSLGDGASARVAVEAGDYDVYSGTSMASPHVAGAAALLLALQKDLSPADVRDRLQSAAVDLGAGGRDALFGFGRVDALAPLGGGLKPGSALEAAGSPFAASGFGWQRAAR